MDQTRAFNKTFLYFYFEFLLKTKCSIYQPVFIFCILEYFFYTQVTFVFHLLDYLFVFNDHTDAFCFFLFQKGFYIVHEGIYAFGFFFFRNILIHFTSLFLKTFFAFFNNILLTFLYIEKNCKRIFYRFFIWFT